MAIYQSKDTMLVKNDVMHDGGPLSPLSLDMLPGDVAVLSNLTMLHAKTEFKDHGDPDKVSLPPHPLPALLHLDISFSVTPMGRMPKLCPCPSCLALSVLTRPAGTQHTSCASGLPPQRPPPPHPALPPAKARHLLRLWVAPPNAPPLPKDSAYLATWGSVDIGSRGG